MRRDLFRRVQNDLGVILGGNGFNLQVVGDDEMSLNVPDGSIPGVPEITIESAPAATLVSDCQRMLAEAVL